MLKSNNNKVVEVHGILCSNCRVILVSWHKHDFKQCSCENKTYVDGGQQEYTRIGSKDLTQIINVTVRLDVPKKEELEF